MLLGYSRADIVTYYIIMGLISLSASAHISRVVRLDIMEGQINSFLLRPFNYILFRSIHELTYKLVTTIIAIILFTTVAVLFPTYVVLPHDTATWFLFIASLVGAFLLALAIQFIISLSSFWMGEINSIQQIKTLMETVFSGQIAPLAFFPPVLQTIASYLPFKYLAYFPAQIYLRQLTSIQIAGDFGILSLWILAAWLVVAWLWKRGVRAYEGVGI